MMAVSKALEEIKFRIPKPILDAVFIQRTQQWRQTPVSIDEHILTTVVRPRVLVDCNLIGGTEAMISLQGLPADQINSDGTAIGNAYAFTTVYRIPKAATQGRSIISVLNVTFSSGQSYSSSYAGMANQGGNAMLQAGSAVMDAMSPIPVTSTAKVQLIGENVVMVKDNVIMPANAFLRCVLANDENMSHLQLKSYRDFSNLVTLAVKAYIYNEYIIQMDLGELHGGQVLGRFKEVIDGYADAEELYQEYLTSKWQKIALMNDSESFTRLLRLMIGGNR